MSYFVPCLVFNAILITITKGNWTSWAVQQQVLLCNRKRRQRRWWRWRWIRLSKMVASSCWSYWLSCTCPGCGSNNIPMTQIAGSIFCIVCFLKCFLS